MTVRCRLMLLLCTFMAGALGLQPWASPAIHAQTGLDVDVSGPNVGVAGQPLSWTASVKATAVTDVIYSWDFGDGSTAQGASVTHTYAAPGSYRLACTASSASGAAAPNTEAHIITIAPANGPVPDATKLSVDADGPPRAHTGDAVEFTADAAGADGVIPDDVVFSWTFGDGASASGADVTHVYQQRGVYTVRVRGQSVSRPSLLDGDRLRVTIVDDAVVVVTMVAEPDAEPVPMATYAAGWNLVSGADGQTFPGAVGPLYTLADDGNSYVAVPALQGIVGGKAYWAYFATETTVALSGAGYGNFDELLLPDRFAMAGNAEPARPATIVGAAEALAWDPAVGAYVETTRLAQGQGAWILPAPPDAADSP